MRNRQQFLRLEHWRRALSCAAACGLMVLQGCATNAPATVSVAELLQHPGERSLANGLRNYEEGAFDRAERDFRAALANGLLDPRDVAVAYKNLAFIACAFNRPADCESNFRLAFAADPNFHLSPSEVGHPIWGPVFQRVAASQGAKPRSP